LQAQIRAALLQRAEAQGIESADDEAANEAVLALQAAIAASIANQSQQQEANRSTVLIGESETDLTGVETVGTETVGTETVGAEMINEVASADRTEADASQD
ncbi:hypothetical protein V6O07_15915, partial [Arthrospira platensis SPKY2]